MSLQTTVPPSIRDELSNCQTTLRAVEDTGDKTELGLLVLLRFFYRQACLLEEDEDENRQPPRCLLKRGEPVDLEAMLKYVLPETGVDVKRIEEELKELGLLGSVQKNGLVFAPKGSLRLLAERVISKGLEPLLKSIRRADAIGKDNTNLKTALFDILTYDFDEETREYYRGKPEFLDRLIYGDAFDNASGF